MCSKKFSIIFLAFLIPNSSSCMFKLIAVFSHTTDMQKIKSIEQELKQVQEDPFLNEYEKNSKLAELYGDLYCAYTKNSKREDYDEKTALFIAQQQEKYAQAFADIKQKEKEIKELEQKIENQLDSKERSEQWTKDLINNYQDLINLCPTNKRYCKELKSLKKLILRNELESQIKELKKTNNKKDLIIAYEKLTNTYDNKREKAPYQKIILNLKKEVAEEEKACQEAFEKHHVELQKAIDQIEHDKNLSTQERLNQLLEESTKIELLFPNYVEQVAKERLRIEFLHRELAKAKKIEEIKKRLQILNNKKFCIANDKSVTIVRSKMQLACLFDETAQLNGEKFDSEKNAEYDIKKARELRYEALALSQAKSTKDPVAEKELLALLAPKVE